MTEISAKDVAELRRRTGAGMMECKKALSECDGSIEKSEEYLRKRGIDKAAKKADRATSQGWIGHYVHTNGRIGVLVEVNCETDFVARNEKFQALVRDLCMHVCATPTSPLALRPEELDPAIVARERAFFAESEDVLKKPANIRDKIVEGKVQKWLAEVCLLQQPFVKDTNVTIQQLITSMIATIGENITIKRFVRFQMGIE
ncbi:MAG: translation elongation factor Ts [Planctomycetota bacterium]